MRVRVPSSLRRLTGSQTVVEEVGAAVTVGELIERLDVRYPGFKEQVCEPDGHIKRFLHIFVNGADMRNMQGMATVLANDDNVSIVPAMAGGSSGGNSAQAQGGILYSPSRLGEYKIRPYVRFGKIRPYVLREECGVKLPLAGRQQNEQEEGEPYRQIGPQEAKNLIDEGQVQIIDVREPWEYNAGHVPGARLVPLNTFLRQPAQFATTDNLLFVCASGERSSVACEMAAALGRKQVYNLSGGTGGWMRKGFPVEK